MINGDIEICAFLFNAFNVVSSVTISASHCGILLHIWSPKYRCLHLGKIGSCLLLTVACFLWRLPRKMVYLMQMYEFLFLLWYVSCMIMHFCWLYYWSSVWLMPLLFAIYIYILQKMNRKEKQKNKKWIKKQKENSKSINSSRA